MKKLKMHTPDMTKQNINKIAVLFPNCLVEAKDDKTGQVERTIDFDLLRQELSDHIVEGARERYRIDWPGKREALLNANAPAAKTFRPCRAESVEWDNTKNLIIEGDNLDALKLLQETYLNKIKMIYIDPPYNTGGDLIYNDKYKSKTEEYLLESNQKDNLGQRLVANSEADGRFHSRWLSMLYPRLKLAKNLLRDDGVIFISIDDNESANLKKLCDEIFSERNFVADICVINNMKGRNDKKYVATTNERLLMYVKSEEFNEHGLDLPEDLIQDYKEQDIKGKYRLIELRKRGGADKRSERPNMFYSFFVDPISGEVSLEKSKTHTVEVIPLKSDGVEGRWRWGRDTSQKNLAFLIGKKVESKNKFNIYEKDYLECEGEIRRIKPKSVFIGPAYSTDVATKQYKSLMGSINFSNPKPLALLEDLVTYSTDSSDHIILDFFAGSGTTGHSVLAANMRDGGKRKFILVQLPEKYDSGSDKENKEISTIADICKERIRRAGISIKKEDKSNIIKDIGFRVLKIDSSNMEDVFYVPSALQQKDLVVHADNIKPDRTSEDLLFQVLVNWGVDLSLPITQETIVKKKVYFVDKNALAACFDSKISEDLVKELAKRKPLRVVFRDSSFDNDNVKINVEQIFKLLSPETEVKTL